MEPRRTVRAVHTTYRFFFRRVHLHTHHTIRRAGECDTDLSSPVRLPFAQTHEMAELLVVGAIDDVLTPKVIKPDEGKVNSVLAPTKVSLDPDELLATSGTSLLDAPEVPQTLSEKLEDLQDASGETAIGDSVAVASKRAQKAMAEATVAKKEAEATKKDGETMVTKLSADLKQVENKEAAAAAQLTSARSKAAKASTPSEKITAQLVVAEKTKELKVAQVEKQATQVSKKKAEEAVETATTLSKQATIKKETALKRAEEAERIASATIAAKKKKIDEASMFLTDQVSVSSMTTFGELCIGYVADEKGNKVMAACKKTSKMTCPTKYSASNCTLLQVVGADVSAKSVKKMW